MKVARGYQEARVQGGSKATKEWRVLRPQLSGSLALSLSSIVLAPIVDRYSMLLLELCKQRVRPPKVARKLRVESHEQKSVDG